MSRRGDRRRHWLLFFLGFALVPRRPFAHNRRPMLDYKQQAQRQWNATPCGTGVFLAPLARESLAWFDEVRRSRYEDTDRWMLEAIDFDIARGKRLLEVGHGMGSDLLTFCEHGAQVFGIDLTPEHHRLA